MVVSVVLVGGGNMRLSCDPQEISADMFVNKMVVGVQCVAKQQSGYRRAEVTKVVSGTEVGVSP